MSVSKPHIVPSTLQDEQAVARRDGLEARIIARTTTRADVDWLVESLELLAAEKRDLEARAEELAEALWAAYPDAKQIIVAGVAVPNPRDSDA